MGQKINPNIFNLIEENSKQSKYIEKKLTEHSVYSKTDLEIKNYTKSFFKSYNIIVNNCKLLYLNNLLYIYVSYYQKVEYAFLKFDKSQLIKNHFCQKETIKMKLPKNFIKRKSFDKESKLINKHKVKSKNLEIASFLETFFISLKKFTSKQFNIFLTLERQNKKIMVLKKNRTQEEKTSIIKRKQKLISLRKYKHKVFFKEGINILLMCITNKNSSKLLAQYLATQIKILKQHNFFIRFIKNTLTLLSDKIFLSLIKGIKIKIKGRFNGRSRSQNRIVQISHIPPVLTKSFNINYFEETSFTLNGTFGVKVWIYQF